jgi:hypothetical protein
MTAKLGKLGHPRIAIALIWFIPAHSSDAPAPAGTAPEPSPITPEDAEFMRNLTGEEPLDLVRRLQAIAAEFRADPATLQAELLRFTEGDEIAARHLFELIRAAEPGNDNGHDDGEQPTGEQSTDEQPTGDGAEILDFERPDDDDNPDDGGQP